MPAIIAGTTIGVVRRRLRPLQPFRAVIEGLAGGLCVGLLLCFYALLTTRAFERTWMTYEVAFLENPSFPWRPAVLVAACTVALCGCRPGTVRFQWFVILLGLLCGGLLITAYRAEIYQQRANLRHPRAQQLPVYTVKPELADLVTYGRLKRVQRILATLPLANREARLSYPAGWFTETAFWEKLPKDQQEAYRNAIPYFHQKGIIATRMEWHTVLTGFYRVQEVPSALWYPGGVYDDAIQKTEYRRIDGMPQGG